jgi:dihydrofolate synthase/folylpolyglutamate synthase
VTFNEATHLLDSLPNFEKLSRLGQPFDLQRYRRFLKRLGSPQNSLKNVVLVAGTKGKGSTCALIDSVLRAAGLKTGLYTSPHLLDVRERIQISGKPIPKPEFARLAEVIEPHLKAVPVTWFEAITAIAFLYFLEQKVTYTLLEVGMGGRLDATNVTHPLVSVITRIGLDHTEVLGDSLPAIAGEKAGILRPRGMAVVGIQPAPVLMTITRRARELKSRLIYVPNGIHTEGVKFRRSRTVFLLGIKQPGISLVREYKLGLLGMHQVENAATALAVLALLSKKNRRITADSTLKGFAAATLPARFQIVRRKPLLVLDGAHNIDSIQALVETLWSVNRERLTVVFGLSRDKPADALLEILRRVASRLILTQANSPRALPVADLAAHARDMGLKFETANTVAEALALVNEPAVVTGSFFVCADALRYLHRNN